MTIEPARGPVPFREYPAAVRPVLGARYVTVCAVFGERSAQYEHGYLLWSDEPFTAPIVAREMTALGFTVVDIRPTQIEEQPWAATISSGPPPAEHTYLGIFHGADCSTIRWIGLWSRYYGRVVHDKPDHGWHTVHAGQVRYEQRDLYELPRDDVVLLTARQATGLAIVAGRRLPVEAELAASIRTELEADWAHQQLWQRFHDHRAAMFADDVQRLRVESARLADLPPHRQPVASYDDRRQVVAGMAPMRVHIGETFPLLRFLVGDFRDRDPRFAGYGSYTVYANRLEVITSAGETIELALQVMVRGGLLVHDPAVTPFCPAEADYTDDPELALARSGDRWPEPLFSAVFPASPAMLEIWGEPGRPSPPTATPSAALPGLGITLTFPGDQQFAAVPGWSDTFHQWQRFIPLDRDSTSRSPGEQTHQIFVPDDLNHMKTVQASITQKPTTQT
jgi:hypothetical protein